ncbi:Restriction of telomere capping protein 5 [Podospora pseudoanserina]|uniref:Restriction of telomere capping protein 5 n=1 Tax=Podospora pseudoanserina TaxID=2609844 RepID=A0ABR0I6M0_9PEZI|nr:Restriction of telomere capping protein 5 [Podospora pseudoanserina]
MWGTRGDCFSPNFFPCTPTYTSSSIHPVHVVTMGQTQSDQRRPPPSREELTKELAAKFADKCFTSLEIYSFKEVFKSLVDQEQNVRHLKEDTIARFLEIPDVLGVSPVIFQMISYIGAFPFLRDAPAVLGLEEMVMVITIMTDRYQRVLATGADDRKKLLFNSLAVYDRKLSEHVNRDKSPVIDGSGAPANSSHASGFAVDIAGDDEDDLGCEDEDDLVLAALDSLDYANVGKLEDGPPPNHALIPAGNFKKIIMLLLLVAPLGAQESLSSHANRVVGKELEELGVVADCIVAAFLDVEHSPGIRFSRFNSIIPSSMPFVFSGFTPLFEHFLFSKTLDFHERVGGSTVVPDVVQPLLQDKGSLLNLSIMSQLSFFIPGESLFRKLRLLYAGGEDGFSMGSFETKVFNWRAPTILLVHGICLPDETHRAGGAETAFLSTLPPRRYPSGNRAIGERVTFGVYLSQPWRHTHRECFGDSDSILFQLQPVHDVFRGSPSNKDYASFTKPSASTPIGGVSFGCPPPQPTQAYRRSSTISMGPVSLVMDSSFEFGCFTHNYISRGSSAFQGSACRKFDFQDRFEISDLEVWGCGGDEEAKHQAERWAWEAREAEARRRINLGTGDIEADRALLEMAGLIGGNRSGGSMM